MPEIPLSQDSQKLIKTWLSTLRSHTSECLSDDPRYYLYKPQSLITTSAPQNFLLGTGDELCANIFSAFRSVQHELLFVTCFWASPSRSQAAFASALRELSARAVATRRRIRVRIGFSSCSLWQKLTQTAAVSGKEWSPSGSAWVERLGLPGAEELRGLDICVRSVFVRPMSVMHPKFVVCDRERLFMPSCNVSWENWFEGCIEMRGDVVAQAMLFWESFWGRDEALPPLEPDRRSAQAESQAFPTSDPFLDIEQNAVQHTASDSCEKIPLSHLGTIATIFLPSPHHRNPCFRPWPIFSEATPPPSTPLNTFLLTAFSHAKKSIYIQSANITSQPVLDALLSALKRGVNVRIVSNQKMQIVEQLVTAGRLTEWALQDLYSQYTESLRHSLEDIESEPSQHGSLEISYYRPSLADKDGDGRAAAVKSHLKLTAVDQEITVLGSGNMDRASWYTSQELGVAFISCELAKEVLRSVEKSTKGCLQSITVPH